MNKILYEDFKKLEIKIGKIEGAQRVEGSEKLLKLQVDLGEETRQIVAGIGLQYGVEELTGRQIVVVANLEPKSLMGLESQGMLLAADTPDGPILLMPDDAHLPKGRETPVGTKIR